MTSNPSAYFVRVDQRIRGPFSHEVLCSMFARGRISSDTQVSADRQNWHPLGNLGGPFVSAEGTIAEPPTVESPPDNFGAGVVYFCSIDGETIGPIHVPDLQKLADSGQLGPKDMVWKQGEPDWGPAHQVAGLSFASTQEQAQSWFKSHPALVVSLTLLILGLFILPTFFVLASASAQRSQQAIQEQQRREKEERDRKEALRQEQIAREKAVREERIAREERQHKEKLAAIEAQTAAIQAQIAASQQKKGQASNAGTQASLGGFSVGEIVTGGSIVGGGQWYGRIVEIDNGKLRVKILTSSSVGSNYYTVGQTYDMLPDEVKHAKEAKKSLQQGLKELGF